MAISGLASHPFGSWQQRRDAGNFMWLRDGLPKDLPSVRTIIYGYDTGLTESRSFKSIHDIALKLVNRLTSVGFGWLSSKPTIFLCHSLGGDNLQTGNGNFGSELWRGTFNIGQAQSNVSLWCSKCRNGDHSIEDHGQRRTNKRLD